MSPRQRNDEEQVAEGVEDKELLPSRKGRTLKERIRCFYFSLRRRLEDSGRRSTVLSRNNEIKRLAFDATKKRSAELKKEKSTWSRAFQKNKEEPDKPEPEVVATAEHVPSQGEDMKSIEEILKTMNINVSGPTGGPQSTTTSAAEAIGSKAAKRSKDIKRDAAAKKSEAENGGEGDSVSDEAFGWMIGATALIGAIGLAAFFVMKSKQR